MSAVVIPLLGHVKGARRWSKDTFPPGMHPTDQQPIRPKLPKAELARRIRILKNVAVGYDLSITIHGQVGRV